MIQMKWRADSENSENSALDTIIVSHKIYEKKLFFHRFDFTSSDSPLKQPTGIPGTILIPGIPVGCLIVQSVEVKSNRLKNIFFHIFCVRQ